MHGLGKHEMALTMDEVTAATKYNFLAIPWNLLSSAMAKVSVCLFLIHVNINRHLAYVLYAVAIAMPLLAIATTSVLFGQCSPASALWTRRGECLPPHINAAVGPAQAVTFVCLDVGLACFPLTFLWTLQMNKRHKMALIAVLSLGVVAGGFGIVRCIDLQEVNSSQDILYSTIDLGIWSSLEQNITIIAASIPPLYSLFRTILGKHDTIVRGRHDGSTYAPGRYYGVSNDGREEPYQDVQSVRLKTLPHKSEHGDEDSNDVYDGGDVADSASEEVSILPRRPQAVQYRLQGGITRTTEFTVVHEHSGSPKRDPVQWRQKF